MKTLTVALLSGATGFTARPQKRRDFSWLVGSWSSAETRRFEESVADCRRVDAEDWKVGGLVRIAPPEAGSSPA